jgi:tetratricopeptide (TPR) repeat protein
MSCIAKPVKRNKKSAPNRKSATNILTRSCYEIRCVDLFRCGAAVLAGLYSGASAQAVALNTQGAQAFQGGKLAEAKNYFAQGIKAVPDSGQAHYNYALTLNALGETDAARQHFIEAANLAPGDKVIWDSPALRPFGSPAAPKGPPKEHPYGTRKPDIGTGPR